VNGRLRFRTGRIFILFIFYSLSRLSANKRANFSWISPIFWRNYREFWRLYCMGGDL